MWTAEEIAAYEKMRPSSIEPIYRAKRLWVGNPEARAEFLGQYLTQTDHDVVMRTAHTEGRAIALRQMEEMAASVFC